MVGKCRTIFLVRCFNEIETDNRPNIVRMVNRMKNYASKNGLNPDMIEMSNAVAVVTHELARRAVNQYEKLD